ncbi:MAG: molybdate ABC transporter substrate-binding protein [Proteobacteria bacterium]|nr:molybdate ABC transporter substrate-binding protein [Pseudomonadota bacterium]
MQKVLIHIAIFFSILFLPVQGQAETVSLFAAGSLKAALGDVIKAFEQASGNTVHSEFGPSGLLRERIEKEGQVNIFASANMKHPQTLMSKGLGQPVALFARNNLCALAQSGLQVTSANLLEVLLHTNTRVGTSTPKADPSGDYAWELFEKADKMKPGSFTTLSGKARQLTGGPDSAKPPAGRNQYGWVMEEKKADVFLTYCTNAVLAAKEVPNLQIVQIAPELAVGADYGIIVLDGAPIQAWRLAMFILGVDGQRILATHGFVAGGLSAQ